MVKKKVAKPKKIKKADKVVDQTNQEPDDRFDFGGLPKTDLKKNLGCG